MLPDPDICYEAMLSRDSRFDGRFFVCVRSTGIYCRSICPAPKPKRRNCIFVTTAAAAQAAGFRPCRRCRPEAAPGSPAWAGTEATVARALRLIGDGALDRQTVPQLAERLGLGERHLRRLVHRHLGAAPKAIALTRRLHLAKQLIDQTGLPMAEIAFAAGFRSLRRFNDAFRRAFAAPPGHFRGAPVAAGGSNNPAVTLSLAYRPPYGWNAMLGFLAARAIPGIETLDANSYRRTLRLGAGSGIVWVGHQPKKNALTVRLELSDPRHIGQAVGRLRRLFDLDASPRDIAASLSADPLLAPLVAASPGLRLPGGWDIFEIAVRAVIGQQISVAGARTLLGRLVSHHGDRLPGSPGPDRLFPVPAALSALKAGEIGLTERRAATLRALARAFAETPAFVDRGRPVADNIGALLGLPGVGPWTAGYIAMRGLAEPDCYPMGDLHLLRATAAKTPAAFGRRAEAWRPWRAYAALYLWQRPAGDITKGKTDVA